MLDTGDGGIDISLTHALRQVELPWPDGVRILTPKAPLPIGSFDFDLASTLACVELGRNSAEAFARANEGWMMG